MENREVINDVLVHLFNEIMELDEQAIITEEYKDITNNDMHIIGIDRGERNLIYVSVIDLHGNIIEQKNFNIINGVNYKEKLKQRESERDSARKNWKQIGKIKDIKEGYLSLVIHEITSLVLKYNAIIAMEDLNMGFKRGRFKVERQVYQKFENMLISKLNYLVDKNKAVNEEGGVLKGYQMTYIPKSLKELGRQCGYIFYVPAEYFLHYSDRHILKS